MLELLNILNTPNIPTFLRMVEILSCSMAGFLPCLLLLIYPFRNHLRLKSFLAGFLSLAMTPALLYYDILNALGTAPVSYPFPLMRSVVFLVFALVVIRSPIWKTLLNTLNIINLSVLITAAANQAADPYTWRWLVTTLVLQAVLLIPYTLYLARCLAPTLNCSEAPVWKLLWIAPAVGTVFALVQLYAGGTVSVLILALLIFLAAVAAALTLYFTKTEMITLILRKGGSPRMPQAAPAASQKADPVKLHYTSLCTRMAESEHSCKEMLLQVMTMEDDLNRQDYDRLREHLNTLRKQLSPTVASTGNKQIDSVLTYFTRQAMLSNVKIVSNVTLPEMSAVSDEDMAVLLGCLLDNALNACREQSAGTRRIALASYLDDDLLQIGIKNTQAEPMDSNCELLNVCRGIAARHGGKLTLLERDGAAQVVVTLNV